MGLKLTQLTEMVMGATMDSNKVNDEYFNTFFVFVLESQKSSDDNECVVDPEMVRLQFKMGSQRLWWLRQVIRAFGSYLVA